MANFNRIIYHILDEEGGYVNNPLDPGGETKYGISKRAYPSVDIKNLKPEKAIEIYRQDYWTPIRGDDLPQGVDLMVLDCAINQGVGAAVKLLQGVLGVTQDGKLGPKTLAKLNSKLTEETIAEYAALRALRYAGSKGWNTFGRGWINRLMRQTVRSSAMLG